VEFGGGIDARIFVGSRLLGLRCSRCD